MSTSSIGQYCINVADIDAAVAFYEALGLRCTSRTEIDRAHEAIVESAAGFGGKLQLAQQKVDPSGAAGTGFWKLYVNTRSIEQTWAQALEAGATVHAEVERMERWPVTIGFVRDPAGYLVELVERDPWPDGAPDVWLGQYCLNVADLDASVAFYERLGLACTSRTDIGHAQEAIVESADGTGGKLQLAQHAPDSEFSPLNAGSFWKLYVHTDDCRGLHDAAVAAGHASLVPPMDLDRWPVTIAFVADPDGYQVELVERRS